MKRKALAGLLALMLLLTLTACGGSAKGESNSAAMDAAVPSNTTTAEADYGYYPADTEEMVEAPAAEPQESASKAEALQGRKLICTAQLELETTEFDQASVRLAELTEEYGGWFESSSVGGRGSGHCWANYTVRVPVARYQAFLNQIGELCHETWRSTEQQDITESYYDTQGRLETQKIKLERLQELLRKAEAMEDIITIESAISETEWMIDDLSGTMRHYDSLVDYATITVSLQEVYKLSNVEEVPDSFGSRIGAAFRNGCSAFADGMENLAVALAYGWMWVLLAAAAVVLVVRILRKRRKKAGKPSAEKRDEQEKQ
ncbi:DUF4349 domain-containing protein [uncultured Dysosmobacter sp.]|uniref:DUF4349 domain-containing protein n=1 Tax=uncultured Dysosmobacter sp. TaxID=2591384 RepID=UPI00260354D5|nr:DUF4349 domain-containing protein [uncultured Dysosmobacter sp.]